MRASLALALLLLTLTACRAGSPCGPESCAGCCGADGKCQLGGADLACGKEGAACSVCAVEQSCQSGLCGAPSGCVRATCSSLGANCGTASDGCGGMLSCGSCGAGDSCGGGGKANVCGAGSCTPTTCAAQSKNCGSLSDGCGALLSCGTCQAPERCGGGGVANVCGGGSCTPTTCAAAGKGCGAISDGCGGMLDCGTCQAAGQSCGGGGVANVCGSACGTACPQTFTCAAGGACSGGDAEQLVLNVLHAPIVSVGGGLLVNGAPPEVFNGATQCGTLTWEGANGLDKYVFPLNCAGTSNITFTGRVVAGTYKVTVQGERNASNLPIQPTVLDPALVLTTANTNLSLSVTQAAWVTINGKLTRNGAAPKVSSVACGSLRFLQAGEVIRDLPLSCVVGGEVTYSGRVPPGTYSTELSTGLGVTDLVPRTLDPAWALSASATRNFDSALPAVIDVGGSLLHNGAAPLVLEAGAPWCAQIRFEGPLMTANEYVACSGPSAFKFQARLLAGTYAVRVLGYYDRSSLPPDKLVSAATSFTVSNPSLTVNVTSPALAEPTLLFQVNGVSPVVSAFNKYCGYFRLRRQPGTDTISGYYPCTPPSTVGGPIKLQPGTYQLTIANNAVTGLGSEERPYPNPLTFASGPSTVTLNFPGLPPKVNVSGTVQHNGLAPVVYVSTSSCGYVRFVNADGIHHASFPFNCSAAAGFTFSGSVHAGTYKVQVSGDLNYASLPDQPKDVLPALTVANGLAPLALNVVSPPAIPVGGVIQSNGAAPLVYTPYSSCGTVHFKNANGVDDRTISFGCKDATAFTFQSHLLAGTYRVSVETGAQGAQQYVRLPTREVVVVDRLTLP